MLEVRFPVSPWENNYIELRTGSIRKVVEPPGAVRTVLSYSFLEKHASLSEGVKWSKDSFSFFITSEKILREFTGIISKPVYLVLARMMREHGLADIKHLNPDESTSLTAACGKVNVEPECFTPGGRKFFVIQCRRFSERNSYSESDLVLSDLCITAKDSRSPACTSIKIINLLLSRRAVTGVEETVKSYLSWNIWPVNFLLMVSLLYLYERMTALSLYLRIPRFGEVIRFIIGYMGPGTGESAGEFSAVGLRE